MTETGPANISDEELVRLARAGDDGAFGGLVDRHRRAVYRAALAACGSAADADDVAQEAFLTAHRMLATFRGDAAFRTWLLSIAWRKALDHRRRLKRWLARAVAVGGDDRDDDIVERIAQPGVTHETALAASELQRDVQRLIRSLPRNLRDALLLVGTGEHTYQEVAAMLGAPAGTIKWRVSEARRLLREKLAAAGHRI